MIAVAMTMPVSPKPLVSFVSLVAHQVWMMGPGAKVQWTSWLILAVGRECPSLGKAAQTHGEDEYTGVDWGQQPLVWTAEVAKCIVRAS